MVYSSVIKNQYENYKHRINLWLIFTRIFIIIILFTLTISGQKVYALDTKSYNLSKYDINILVNKDGFSNFEERLTYNFDGKFNIPGSNNIVNENALPRILANQVTLAEKGNNLAIFLILIWFLIISYLYKKYDKEFKQDFKGKYYRELPGDYTPAEMSVLMSSGRVNSRDNTEVLLNE